MKRKALATLAVCGMLGISLFACVPELPSVDETQLEAKAAIPKAPSVAPGTTAQEIYEYNDLTAEQWAPKVRTLEDGTQVQLTPDSGDIGIYEGSPSSFNTLYLDADNRGCDSCHTTGLADLVDNSLSLSHYPIDYGLGTNINVFDCIGCHQMSPAAGKANKFGSLIHGIHDTDVFNGTCMSCHDATADGKGMQLWEEAKYDLFHGMVEVENVQGTFDFNQDQLGGSPIWTNHMYSAENVADNAVGPLSGPADTQEMFDNWEISISGMVEKPFSITMKEIVEEGPVQTFTSAAMCILNPIGGEDVGNFEVTGIPMSWLLEKAGVMEGAKSVIAHPTDGFEWGYGDTIEDAENGEAWLIWEINGEPLSNLEGFPVRTWNTNYAASGYVRWASDFEVSDVDPWVDYGEHLKDYIDENGEHHLKGTDAELWGCKPNAGICNIHEGQIIPAGQEYQFEGYAYAIDEQVTAVEFSMDNGKTWTSFDTSSSDHTRWVYWHFGFTPEERGAYVFCVRAISSETGEPYMFDKVMVNAK